MVSTIPNLLFSVDLIMPGRIGTTSMDVRVYHTHWLRFQINYTTGILDVREARTAGMAALEKRIALVKNTLDDAPQRLLEQVYSLKKQVRTVPSATCRIPLLHNTAVRPGCPRDQAGVSRSASQPRDEGCPSRR